MRILFSMIAAFSMVAGLAFADQRDPLGETAFYKIDKDSSRTHNMVKSGIIDTNVTRYLPEHADGPAYEVTLYYKFKIQWMGDKEGTQLFDVPAEFFTEQFMIDLRANGTYETADFKMKHEGYGDATTMDGNFYPNCDKVLIYDVKQRGASKFEMDVTDSLAGYYGLKAGADIEDLEIRTMITADVPVLGAVKIDMSGVYSGMNVFVGGDYEAP